MGTPGQPPIAVGDHSYASATTRGDEPNAQGQETSTKHQKEYPAYLNLLQNIPPVIPYDLDDDELHHMPSGSKDSGWQNCLHSVEKYDRELCQTYRDQIDTLLVFAGLFSAVVTAFAVESYQWLQDDPLDASVELLRDVVDLLAQNLNLTAFPAPIAARRLSDAAIVRINSFWFLSLTLSLSAALVGILCKQWLREFERNVGQSPEIALAVRYIRFQGFEFWTVGSIITSVPIIMQAALAFFLVGVIELLWRLHTIVACCVTVAAGLTLTFYLATTFLPVIQYACICMRCYVKPFRNGAYPLMQAFTEPQCAFKSAQAWLAFRVFQPAIKYILKAYGYQFSSHHPPAYSKPVLRHIDSWVSFDLNWVKCRENIHVGPRCAFESLTWIAGNLGEMQMSSWIWHCVWARWMKNRDSPDDLIHAEREIGSIARSYPRIVALGDNNTLLVQTQALIFQCSLRADLPVDTALELLLRVAPATGVNSQWTREALHAVRVVYREQSVRVSDDIAAGLFRLAELETHAILYGTDGPNGASKWNAALVFKDVVAILHRGTHLRDIFMPAMSGLVLQWLRSGPPEPIRRVAKAVFENMIWYLVSDGYRGHGGRDLRQHRAIMFIAKLAGAVVELWPEYGRGAYYEQHLDERGVLRELVVIFYEGFAEQAQDVAVARMGPDLGLVDSPIGKRSSSPGPAPDSAIATHAAEETHAESTNVLAHRVPGHRPHSHLSILAHGEDAADAAEVEVSMNCPAPPADSPASPEPWSPQSMSNQPEI